jgi:hypothetical protein
MVSRAVSAALVSQRSQKWIHVRDELLERLFPRTLNVLKLAFHLRHDRLEKVDARGIFSSHELPRVPCPTKSLRRVAVVSRIFSSLY